MRFPRSLCLSGVFAAHLCGEVRSQDATSDAYAARDICVGVAAKFVNAPAGAEISYENGKFKIAGTVGGQATVFEGAASVGTISDFDYRNYTQCVSKFATAISHETRIAGAKKTLALFNATLELNNTMYIGTCLKPAAEAGMYFGDVSQSNIADGQNIIGEDHYEKFLVALDKSLQIRLKNVLNSAVQFALEDDLQYFRFVPGRFVPYFTSDAIEKNNAINF